MANNNRLHTPIYAKQPIYQQQQQPHQPQLASPTPAKALPPPPLYTAAKNAAKIEQKRVASNHSNTKISTNSTASAVSTIPVLHLPNSNVTPTTRPIAFKQPNGPPFGVQKTRSDPNNYDSPTSINGSNCSSGPSSNGNASSSGSSKCRKNSVSNARTFIKPKTETKVFIGKRLTTIAEPLATGKTKRSYGQTPHHESMQRILQQNLPTSKQKEWHAPDSYLFDSGETDELEDELEVTRCAQIFWLKDLPSESFLTREQRLEIKRDNLRRQAVQYSQAQTFRSTSAAKKRLSAIIKTLNKLTKQRDQ